MIAAASSGMPARSASPAATQRSRASRCVSCAANNRSAPGRFGSGSRFRPSRASRRAACADVSPVGAARARDCGVQVTTPPSVQPAGAEVRGRSAVGCASSAEMD